MKKLFKNFCKILITAMLVISVNTNTIFAAVELDTRKTIYYPSSNTQIILNDHNGGSLFIPKEAKAPQDAKWNGNSLSIGTALADSGFATSNDELNLANNNYVFVYQIKTDVYSGVLYDYDNYGSTFALHNDPMYSPNNNSDYGSLGVYGMTNGGGVYNYLHNAVVVEFDNENYAGQTSMINAANNPYYDSASGSTTKQSHIAITTPGNAVKATPITHEAISQLTTPYANNAINTVRITWSLTNEGATSGLNDNIYTLKYEYFQGQTSAAGTSTVSGSKNFTYDQLIATFGGETAYFSLSASSGLAPKPQLFTYPTVYQYQINYLVKRADGTTVPVPGVPSISGTAPSGTFDAGPILPEYLSTDISSSFRLVTSPLQSRTRTIKASTVLADNTFNFYYEQIPRSLIINKFDLETKERMKDVTFTLTDDDGSAPVIFKTDVNGMFTMNNLFRYKNDMTLRTYTLTETTPNGYFANNPIKFTINSTGQIVINNTTINDGGTFDISNKPFGSITLNKTDSTDIKNIVPFKGAGFTLERLNSSGIFEPYISEILTNDTGQIQWNELSYGTYKITETKVPIGYNIANKPIILKIDQDNRNPILSFQNQMTTVMPTTGGLGPLIYYILGTLGILSGFIIIKRKGNLK